MRLSSTLANGAWLAGSVPAWRHFSRALSNPSAAQAKVLRRLLAVNRLTAFGQTHRFGSIQSYRDFCEQVPVSDYEQLSPWIVRVQEGELDVLTAERVTRLVPTSGSSGPRKLIPYTPGLQREFNAAIGPWMVDLARQTPAIAFGPAYWSISPALAPAQGERASRIPIGFDDDSAYLGGWRQRIVETVFAVPSAVRSIANIDDFRYATLLCLLRQPHLRLVSVWHPSFLTLLLETLEQSWDELLRDLAQGGCDRAANWPNVERGVLAGKPQVSRAGELANTDPKEIRAIWPRLALVSCWGDGQAHGPWGVLRERLRGVELQAKGLIATEAFVTIPFAGAHPVALRSHFYEFLDADGGVHPVEALRLGEIYEVVVSTSGGLWRYRLGDLVRVETFLDRTPSLRFLGRAGNVSDLCGEKLSEIMVTRVLQAAGREFRFAPGFVLLAPEEMQGGTWRYVLFHEEVAPAGWREQVEKGLGENPHYAWARKLGQLAPLETVQVPAGAQERMWKRRLAEGRRLGDLKPQALVREDDWRAHLCP